MILQAYKSRSTNDQLLLIFSAEDLSQAYRRIRYLQQFNEYRKQKAAAIISTGQKIEEKLKELEESKAQKVAILSQEQEENTKLLQERQEKEVLVEKLKSKESELKANLEKKQREKAQLDLEIKKIIEKEIEEDRKRREREAAKKREEEAKKGGTTPPAPKTETPKTPALTPEAKLASTNFEGNKGNLPWPVEKGIITGKYGTYPHPVFSNIQVKNDGIDITTDKYSNVRAVFEGIVSGTFNVTGYGKVIIIRHGEYLSVYSNLIETKVNKDDKVKTKDIIGKAELNEEGNRSSINFQIRKGSITQNPEHWLSR
jgi:septal ring factor EnvC (AmiA/AmiB activator)